MATGSADVGLLKDNAVVSKRFGLQQVKSCALSTTIA